MQKSPGTSALRRSARALARDRRSGALEIALRAARILSRFAKADRSARHGEFSRRLGAIAFDLVSAQPSMAPLWNLANGALCIADSRREVEEARAELLRWAREEERALSGRPSGIARVFARRVKRREMLLTYGRSSTVLASLRLAHRDGAAIRVICLESRSGREGARLARELASSGLRVELCPETMAGACLAEVDRFVVGGDAIGKGGLVSRAGTALIVEEARRRGVPVLALCGTEKWLAPAIERRLQVGPARQENAPGRGRRRRLAVSLSLFDLTPVGRLSFVVSEKGWLRPERIGEELSRRRVADLLR